MYGVTKTIAIAALIFLSAFAMEARAQNTYGGATVVHAGTIGLVPGQTVSIRVFDSYFSDGSLKFSKHSVKVYAVNESQLTYSGESGGLGHEFGHIFTLRHYDLPVPGDPRTGRIEVYIEVESVPLSATEDISANVASPTFEVIDELTGRTVLSKALGRSNAAGRTVSLSLRARPELSTSANEIK